MAGNKANRSGNKRRLTEKQREIQKEALKAVLPSVSSKKSETTQKTENNQKTETTKETETKKNTETKSEKSSTKTQGKETLKTKRTSAKANRSGGNRRLTTKQRKIQEEQYKTRALPQAITRFTEKAINDVALAPVAIPYQIATGKKLVDLGLEPTTKSAKTGANVGSIAGDILSYGTGYKAAEKAVGKAAGKALASKTGKKAVEKAAASKVGQKIGEKTVKKVAENAVKSAIADATVGTTLNLSHARGEGLEGEELAKDMALNAALDFGVGGVIEALPVAKALIKNRAGKNTLKTAANNTAKTVKTATESVEKTVNAELHTKAIKTAKNGKKTVDLPATSNKRLTSNDEAEYLSTGNDKAKYLKTKRSDYKGKKVLASEEIPNYVEDSINGVVQNDIKPYGKVGNRLSEEVKALSGGNVDIGNYHLELSSDDLRHAYKNHSTAKQAGNLPLSLEDFKNAVDYVDNYDDVLEVIPTKKGTRILLGKQINGHSVITEIVSEPSKSLRLKNMWKLDTDTYLSRYNGVIKEKAPMLTTSQPKNGETYYQPSDMLSTQSISGSVENVKLKDLGEDTAKNTSDIPQSLKQEQPEIKVNSKGEEIKVADFDVEGGKTVGIVSPGSQTIQEAMENASGFFDRFYKNFVNSQHEIDKLSKAAGDMRASNAVQAARSASGTSEYIYTKGLVNPKGEVIDDRSFYDVFKPISKNSKEFNEYAQHLNNISRWAEGKPLDENITAEQSKQFVNDMLAKHPEFAQMTQDLNSWWQKFTHAWLVDTGRMTENAWQTMTAKYPNYVPAFMPDKGVKIGGSKFAVGSGTKAAKAGNTLNRMPIEDAMMQQVQQMVKTTRKNDLYLNVIDTLRNNPDELKRFGIVKQDKQPMLDIDFDDFMTAAEEQTLKEVNSKVYTISAMENGQKITAYINKDLAEAFAKIDNVIGSPAMQDFVKAGKLITNPLKAGITGYNPIFAIANAARDIPTALIQSQYGLGKTTKNMVRAIGEMATNGEMWNRYLALGGKTGGYINAHKGFEKNLTMSKNPITKVWEGMKTVLGSFGEATEAIPRFAEFMSSMEKYGDTAKAITDASEITVNFSRAGEITKTLDAWTLYLNAAVQGLDKFARTMKANPLRTSARSIGVVGAPYALLMLANWDNPHYQDLNDRTKQNYYCIPNMAGEYDEQGYAKTFIKIPVNREYGTLFASTLDVIGGYLSGEADPWNGFSETVKENFLPPNPLTDNVLAPIVYNLPQNVDFAGRKIVPTNLENVSPELQQDYSTSGLAKNISKVASNLNIPSETLRSPMKVDYLLDSFGGYLGQIGQAATDQSLQGADERLKGVTIDPFIDRFSSDARFSSGVISDFYDKKEAAERAYNDIKVTTGEKGKEYVTNKVYTDIQNELSDISKQEKEILTSNLSKQEKDEQIKKLRETRNELARSADERVSEALAEYNSTPLYAVLTNPQKERYEKDFESLKISKEDYAKAVNATADIDTDIAKVYALVEAGISEELAIAMTSKTAVEKAVTLASKDISMEEVIQANQVVKDSGYTKAVSKAYAMLDNGIKPSVVETLVSEKAAHRATWCKQAGITPEMLDQVAAAIDANENGSYSKTEIINFFNQNPEFSTAEKRAIFLSLNSSENSPY